MFQNVKEKWGSLVPRAKAGLLAGVAATVLFLVAGAVWLAQDDYQVLFSELNAQDASAMVSELDRLKVPYRLAEGGTAIFVEREMVYKTRLKLMGRGLDLHGAVGLEIFNNVDYGMTEFAQKVNYQRALQGELARTIMGFEEVKHARVHLVLPESGLLKRQSSKPKASISLVMKSTGRLSPEQITGIQRLVAASVPEIEAAAVTVVDQHGVAVSKLTQDDQNGGIAGRLDTKRQIEEYLTRKVIGILDRAVGPGRAVVSVDVSLSYDQVKITKEDIVPLPSTNGQVVGAVARHRESSQGMDSLSELITAGGSARSAQSPVASSSSTETEYLNGRRVEQVVSQPGAIRRLSVGVMVPDIIDPIELAKLKEVISMAVGINVSRGDGIVVYNQSPLDSGTSISNEAEQEKLPLKADTQLDEQAHEHANGSTNSARWFAMAAAGILALLAFALLGRSFFVRSAARAMTQQERQQMLDELSRWVKASRG